MQRRRWLAIMSLAVLLCGAGGLAMAKEKKKGSKSNIVVVKTSMGSFTVELFPDKAPKTVENFLAYVDAKFYDGTIFHRVIGDFMIQGGGFDKDMKKKDTREAIVNEASNGLSNAKGTLAMARTGDPHSATSQFFVNVVDNPRLDRKNDSAAGAGYCVFGKVTAGLDVVEKIKAVATTTRSGMSDVPVDAIIIESIRRK